MNTSKFLKEIFEQPDALRLLINKASDEHILDFKNLKDMYKNKMINKVIFTGMGSSLNASIPASIYLSSYNIDSFCLESSELLHYADGLLDKNTLLIAVSQSGESAEVVKLINKNRKNIGNIVACTNNKESSISKNADLVLDMYAGIEETASTKTYINSVALLYLISCAITSTLKIEKFEQFYKTADFIECMINQGREKVKIISKVFLKCQNISIIARGPSVSAASQGALMLKETARLYAESISAGQFRHGPLEITGVGHGAIILVHSGKTSDLNLKLAKEIAEFGSEVLIITDMKSDLDEIKKIFTYKINNITEYIAPMLQIIPLELISLISTENKGLLDEGYSRIEKVTTDE